MLNQFFPRATTPLRLPRSAREHREGRNSSHINHSPWERWRRRSTGELEEEDVEEENGVPETMGGQRRMCVQIAGSAHSP